MNCDRGPKHGAVSSWRVRVDQIQKGFRPHVPTLSHRRCRVATRVSVLQNRGKANVRYQKPTPANARVVRIHKAARDRAAPGAARVEMLHRTRAIDRRCAVDSPFALMTLRAGRLLL